MPEDVNFPELLETDRLVLRRYTVADAPEILELVDKNRDRLLHNFSEIAKNLSSDEDVESFTADKAEQWNARKTFCFGIWCKDSNELIGQLQAKNIMWSVPSGELSYFIGGSFQRQGFASESVSAMLRVALGQLGIRRVFVRIIPSNKESILLANKLGFKHEGLHRNEFRCGLGELHDVNYFSMTSDDFKSGLTSV